METRFGLTGKGGTVLEKERKAMPKIIVGIEGTVALQVEHAFRQMGWRTHTATTADEAKEFAVKCKAAIVVLPVKRFAESGFLTCAKLVAALPKTKVWLVGPADEELERFALFAGAAGYLVENWSAPAMVLALTTPSRASCN